MSLNSQGFSASTRGACVGREQDNGLGVGAAPCPQPAACQALLPSSPCSGGERPFLGWICGLQKGLWLWNLIYVHTLAPPPPQERDYAWTGARHSG